MIDERSQSDTLEISGSNTDDDGVELAQYVAFVVGEQTYCVDAMAVREIRAWTGATSLPNVAEYVRGVINLRGVVVPVIDLRARFGQGATDPTKSHVVVIAEIKGKLIGMLVDKVSDILTIRDVDVMPIPDTGGELENPYLEGLISRDEELVAMITLDRLIEKVIVH